MVRWCFTGDREGSPSGNKWQHGSRR
jgi:hypothetical protein